MPLGRPTLYDPTFCQKVDEYLLTCVDTEGNVRLPKREGFAKYLNVTRQTIDNWSKEYPEFFDALSKIDLEQKDRLVDNGLAGKYNSTIAKLVLSANHGMAEKTDTDITSKGDKIDAVAVQLVRVNQKDQDTRGV